ncbi:EAL domain-containing protein [Dechloromonas sp. XY25]|uniref:EAL domain-containing protein n=1 Tax=Dechloromonas hankyongensis TaxID=2908002 RepID=A0ABS9JYU4_9RHOO|nr:EAL domain-containing protein [Dechloromonas hankyongensis]MCG2576073.1 EAL domain-containing protein [Dechloromonas hankyongensis]
MNLAARNFAVDYEMAFVEYLEGGDEETALQRAYELGRRAIAGEQSILGLIDIHHRLLQTVEAEPSASRTLPRSEAFLTQVLALFEMTHRQTLDLNRSLHDSERRKAAILGSAFDSIVTFDIAGRIIEFNPAAEQMFGHSRADAVGRDLVDLIVPPARREAFRLMLAFCRGKCDGAAAGQREEMTALRADSSEFPVEMAVTLVDVNPFPFFAAFVRDLSERKAYEAKIEYLATHDALTDLVNRNLLKDRLENAIAHLARDQDNALAVLFVGVERFKFINDSMGHSFGDALIREIAIRLRQVVHDGDTLARHGSDQFVIVMDRLKNGAEEALQGASKVLAAFMQPFTTEGHAIHQFCSIGVSLYPNDGKDAENLLANADAAMHRAKAAGGGTVRFYTRDLSVFAAERVKLESALWSGLERSEFSLFYQPQVRVRDNAIVGAEALIRWQHPEFGMVYPARFIGLAEETGLIRPIGEWALVTANAQNRVWRSQGFPELRMAINVSTRQFRDGGILHSLQALLAAGELDPGSLELEVTESSMMDDMEESIGILNDLRALGASISLDDFGTGYSSLAYLRRLPVDRLKIDQSFVHDMESDPQKKTMIKEIIHLALAFNLGIIAEGVETSGELGFLAEHGCHEYQGYFYSRPVSASEFERLLRAPRTNG